MTTEQAEPRTRKRDRSPSYPGIDLAAALQRAQALYSQEREHAASVETILDHWGYEPKSGGGLVVLAALKKFGLLVDEGTGSRRKARLSDEAVRILLDEREDSTERERLMQEAALKPPIHMELWQKYGASLPSDSNLRHELRFEKGFTGRGVAEFIPQFRSTLTFAQLAEGDKLSADGEDKEHQGGKSLMTPPPPSVDAQAIQLPIATGEWATLQASFPLTAEKWKQMLAVLNAMKPALVGSGSGDLQEDADLGNLDE